MNDRIEDLMYHAGLTAQGCWDSMDDYDHQAIKRFAELIIRQCAYEADLFAAFGCPSDMDPEKTGVGDYIKNVFGVEE